MSLDKWVEKEIKALQGGYAHGWTLDTSCLLGGRAQASAARRVSSEGSHHMCSS